MMSSSLATVSYIGATILFILSLGGLSHPESSRRGNLYGMIGMTIAVLATVSARASRWQVCRGLSVQWWWVAALDFMPHARCR